MMTDQFGGWGFVMMLFWLAFFVFIVIVAMRLLRGHNEVEHGKEDPLEVIKLRYAKGGITKEQFEELKKALK